MQVLTWIWPLNWFFTMKQLRAENQALRQANIELQSKLAVIHIQQSIALSTYTNLILSHMRQYSSLGKSNES